MNINKLTPCFSVYHDSDIYWIQFLLVRVGVKYFAYDYYKLSLTWRSRINEEPHPNAPKILINTSCAPDPVVELLYTIYLQTCEPITLFPIKSQSCKILGLVFWAMDHFFRSVNYFQWMLFDCQSQKWSHSLPLSLPFFTIWCLCQFCLVAGGELLNFFKQ